MLHTFAQTFQECVHPLSFEWQRVCDEVQNSHVWPPWSVPGILSWDAPLGDSADPVTALAPPSPDRDLGEMGSGSPSETVFPAATPASSASSQTRLPPTCPLGGISYFWRLLGELFQENFQGKTVFVDPQIFEESSVHSLDRNLRNMPHLNCLYIDRWGSVMDQTHLWSLSYDDTSRSLRFIKSTIGRDNVPRSSVLQRRAHLTISLGCVLAPGSMWLIFNKWFSYK